MKKDENSRPSEGPPTPPPQNQERARTFSGIHSLLHVPEMGGFNEGLVKDKKLFPALSNCGDGKKKLEAKFCAIQLHASLSWSSHKPPHILSFLFY